MPHAASRAPRPSAVLLAAAALAPGASAQGQGLAPPPWDDFAPIRFGDPDAPAYDAELFPGADPDPALPDPDALLGQPLGSRPAHHAEILGALRTWAAASPRLVVETYGATFEGRELVRAVVTSPGNHRRLDEIRAGHARLADPRGLSEADGERLVEELPAVAWLGYSVHGDELSGCDAALALVHHLVADRTDATARLLEATVVVVDPCMNPDGRERIVAQLEQSFGYVPNMDYASMQRGRWPAGRGNHYLFDMNRDWLAGVAPETRGRWRALRDLPPQLFVDAHEMGALDTYLFYPQSPARNPELPATLDAWHAVFGAEQARAFDAQGWGYYTREWADAWGPFYSDAWGSLGGAVGILYEQASSDGQPVMRASGEVVTYRESVHGHVVSSLSNVRTLAGNREAVLRDYLAGKRANVAADTPGNERVFVCVQGRNREREDALLEVLLGQGFEVHRAAEAFTAEDVLDAAGRRHEELALPAGSLLVAARQPLRPRVRAFLDFDPRMTEEELAAERSELERKGRSKIYDVTAWDLAHAFDLDAYWCDDPGVERARVEAAPVREGRVVAAPEAGHPAYAWAVDGSDDSAAVFAAQALELGLQVHLADKAFTTAGRRFPAGSLLVRRHENGEDVEDLVRLAADRARATVFETAGGRSTDAGPDLGGGHFHLLHRPRIAILGNAPVRRDTFGHLWYLLDHELRVPYSVLDATSFGFADLRRYNVLVVPPGWGALRQVLEDDRERLATWVRAGGTLIACGSSAAAVASEDLGLTSVRLRRDVLEDLDAYERAARRARAALEVEVDPARVWGDAAPDAAPDDETAAAEPGSDAGPEEPAGDPPADPEEALERDRWMRRFAPQGAFARSETDPDHWLTYGMPRSFPAFVEGDAVLLARPPARTAVRLAPADELRLAGLIWPEARERLGDSAWLATERVGDGQVVLFAGVPGFRGYFRASARLFANAVLLGPGAGAAQPIGW